MEEVQNQDLSRDSKYPGDPYAIKDAIKHIYEAHAERLSKESRENCARAKDIEEGKHQSPRALDMFTGGGSIPLEALRSGCDAYAAELTPVAVIIELVTLVYPTEIRQKAWWMKLENVSKMGD